MWSFPIMELLCASEYPYLFNLLVCYLKNLLTFFFSLPITMDDGYPYMDEMVICFEYNLDLEKCFENKNALVELLIFYNKPSQFVIKEVLRAAWNTMRVVKVIKGKEYLLHVHSWRRSCPTIVDGSSPWFIKEYTFTVKHLPFYYSLDGIQPNRATY